MQIETMLTAVDWAVVVIMLPLAGGIACFLWPVMSKQLGLITVTGIALSVAGLGWRIMEHGAYRHAVGGWGAPLGIDLFADGLSLCMLIMITTVGLGISFYASSYFESRRAVWFWPIWLFLLAALNALFLSADIFNLYVTLELTGLAAVALTALTGRIDALNGAMRYLLAMLLGSLTYLLGVALLYHDAGSVDIATLAQRIEPNATVWTALGLMSAGLALKTALFPLNFWLPPAHASAPAPVSALLSALVVKASFYILLRLWLEIFGSFADNAALLLGLLGATAILWGSLQALCQTRIKLLVAYSTVAQIGYLFLAYPLASGSNDMIWSVAVYLAFSHALAKSAMFLATGNLIQFGGHDRITDLDRAVQRLPLTVAAFALAGVSIMGLPPSSGFTGKWLLLETAVTQERWDLALVIIAGGVLAAGYVFKVLGYAFTQAEKPHDAKTVSASMEWTAFLLAAGAILLGFMAPEILTLIRLDIAVNIDGKAV
ncbi:Formate hydrogenlyase subunit 3/Multisubunit Na+/H+ antiporter, MnhD subunit [Nitrosomonas sp. Nm51]|uniref:complex I subunit 5 family protein n=1 Tax=Nitrosomonas sp. Nm51 TaxID=133720 RepID=UPI0008C7E864|nr:proton-conducting transporter membrane subunit [Nitrosomonas sp. Nm51]SER02837.1 Formate hydrogenlyase subunit 3/Multisubunit Na+/H+ antiporter, MnhD subunit [Nitrosomonas sp. Nm51]